MKNILSDTDKIWLTGDVRYTPGAAIIFEGRLLKAPTEFLLSLQNLMEEYGVVKVDVSTDPFLFEVFKKEKTNVSPLK